MVGGIPTPLKNMSSSVGIIIPNIWTKNVPNHQPVREAPWFGDDSQPSVVSVSLPDFYTEVSLKNGSVHH